MKLTKKQAKKLSIKKWEYIVDNDGSERGLTEVHPILEDLKANCGYCEIYSESCKKCPLNLNKSYKIHDFACRDISHPWKKWYQNHTKANAQKVLDLIKQT